jgi:hypothetical protein
MKLRISIVVLMALTPALVSAKPKTPTAHVRPQLFRDRAPKARLHDSHVREVKVKPPKSTPLPAVKEDF